MIPLPQFTASGLTPQAHVSPGSHLLSGLSALAISLLILWPVKPQLSPKMPGPSLQRAQDRGTLRVAVRSYARPALPGETLEPEPDEQDLALAKWLALKLQTKLQLVPGEEADLQFYGASDSDSGATLSLGSHTDGSLQLVALRQQVQKWKAYAPGNWQSTTQRLFSAESPPPSVCLGRGVAPIEALERRGLKPLMAKSSIHAISDFLAGKCDLLAETSQAVSRLLTLNSWRFYIALGQHFSVSTPAFAATSKFDISSQQWLKQILQEWSDTGLQYRALNNRVSSLTLETSLLEDGAICH